MHSRLLALVLVVSLPSIASADMIPSCPPGLHVQMNPVPPGAMHHAGGGCVDDPAAPEPPETTPEPETAEPPAPEAPAVQPTERPEEAHAAPDEAAPAAQGGGCSVAGRSSGAAWMALTTGLAAVVVAIRSRRAC